MDIDEIKRYIHLSHGYVEVSRNYMPEYSGICRRTFIRENKIQIDFCTEQDVALNAGESTFYFEYENFENVIKSAESFLKKPVSDGLTIIVLAMNGTSLFPMLTLTENL